MAMMKRVVEDAEELGLEWVDRRTEDVVQDIALMRLGIQQGYIDPPADYWRNQKDSAVICGAILDDWEEPCRDARGASSDDESDFYQELERGFSQDRI
jgi:hypothetical protein